MKLIRLFSLLVIFSSLGSCKVIDTPKEPIQITIEVTGPIEITGHKIEKTSLDLCSINGTLVDEEGNEMVGINVKINGTKFNEHSNLDGTFKFENIPPGNYTLEFNQPGIQTCTAKINLEAGDKVKIDAIIALNIQIELLKPIVYLYPEEKTEVEIELNYDGKITTTYPKYGTIGWKVTAFPDGTLIDQNDKEYYALYWEGEPRKALGINDGFVVSKERTIPFLEEKLALLGLTAKESNEFIVFWLPILEKNDFNLIHFAGDDYLEQAKLNITPSPDTEIRIAMVFQGLEDEIDFPLQDLSSLMKSRKGFTVVEWGGQELPKTFKLGI